LNPSSPEKPETIFEGRKNWPEHWHAYLLLLMIGDCDLDLDFEINIDLF
jgi:hypothetical protein